MTPTRRMSRGRYITDPPSAKQSRQPTVKGTVFDVQRIEQALKAGLIEGLPPMRHPSDDLLISTVVAHGCPRWAAEQMKFNPALRLAYCIFWANVKRAAQGNSEAKEIVDAAISAWQQMRKDQAIHERPDMSIGLWER